MYDWLAVWTNQNPMWSRQQKAHNVDIIAGYFLDKGWTLNAVCGMLGNMEDEGLFNPGQWQIGHPIEDSRYPNDTGFGLVQWTPWQKFGDWVSSLGYSLQDYDMQLERIQYEMENGLQWEMRAGYDISFQDYVTLEESLEYMTSAFFWCYEYGTWFESRIANAYYWWNYLTGNPPPPPTPTPDTKVKNEMPIIFYIKPKWKRGL